MIQTQAVFRTNPNSSVSPVAVPAMTGAAMRALYLRMTEEYAISTMQRIETSGLRVAQLAQTLLSDFVDDDIEDRPISILVGVDHISAVGLVAARHLEEWGAWVQVVTTHPLDVYRIEANSLEADQPEGGTSPATSETIQAMTALLAEGVSTAWAEDGWELPPADLIIDAITTVLDGTDCDTGGNADCDTGGNADCDTGGDKEGKLELHRGNASYDLIQLVNSHHAAVLSVGLPAGIDPDSGEPSGPVLSATSTLALGFPVAALSTGAIGDICGDIYLADVDIPAELYALTSTNNTRVDKAAIFGPSKIVRLEKCAF